jgi:4-hydroxymandelate oxidase
MDTRPVCLADYETLARRRLDQTVYDYYAGGAGDERTLAENRRAFERVTLWPRVLVNVARVDTTTEILGQRVTLPVLLAPTAFNRLAHADGELAAARAAAAAGTIMVASTLSTWTLEDIAAASDALWFQLYVYRDRAITRELVERAHAAGYRALVLTADSPVLGRRDRDARNHFALPPGMTIKNLEHAVRRAGDVTHWEHDFAAYVREQFDASLDWDAVAWLRSLSPLPLVVKGILAPQDARLAVAAGARALVVSNHGGRQLDGVPASLTALPAVVEAVGRDAEVLLDGGVRRVLEMLRAELEAAMALAGRPTIASIDGSLVTTPGAAHL